jgi:hypothetical protein
MGDMTATASQALQKRLDRIVTKNGVGGSALNQRFILTASAVELTKDITPTEPPIYSYTLEINFVIGDVITGTKFAATSIERKGSGKSETKAYMKAIKSISPRSKKYNDFLEEAKTKIMEYYNANCDIVLKEASALGDQKKYDEAIAKLVAVPDVCKECYDKAMDQSTLIYKAKMENECQQNISQAKASIATDDWEGAASFIAGYTPDLACYTQVEGILILIKDHKCAKALGKAQAAWANRDSREASAFLAEIPTDSKCATDAKVMHKEINDHICAKALGKAQAAWANRDSREASRFLADISTDSKCASDAKVMHKEINDHICAEALGKAKGAWANRDSRLASSFLINVSTDSKCAAEAEVLSAEISSKLDAAEKRDWDEKMKQQKRLWGVEDREFDNKVKQQDREFDNKVKQQSDDVMLRKLNIERMRAVGVAAAKKPTKNNK